MKISRVYLHYPFCSKKCHYCNFIAGVSPSSDFTESYHRALLEQIDYYKNQYEFSTLKSLYLGGGTPSLMPIKFLEKILSLFPISSDTEITLEINPETIQKDWYKLGINRASLGWQSMNDDILKFLGRTSTADDNIKAFDSLREMGFDNISVDRILSVNGDDDELFFEAIKKCKPEHISSYQLSIEDRTVLALWTKQKKYTPVPDELAIKKEENIASQLASLGYNRYEVSNYAQQSKEGQHNLGYWNYENWLGLGVGASGFLPNDDYGYHYTNTSSFHEFCKNPLAIQESESIDIETAIKEFIMLGIRKRTGIDTKRFQEMFGVSLECLLKHSLDRRCRISQSTDEAHKEKTDEGLRPAVEAQSDVDRRCRVSQLTVDKEKIDKGLLRKYFIEGSWILKPEMIALTNPIILEMWESLDFSQIKKEL